jgi:non-ribosomal peptide synthetase component E (peptide arylation enzyme)
MSNQGVGTRARSNVAAEIKPHHPIPGITYRQSEYAHDQLQRGNWLDMAIGESLRRTSKQQPDKVAVIDPGGPVTFRELDARSESVAASLLNMGLKPSDRALFQVGTTKEFFTAFFGCMKAGVVPVCTLPQYRLSEMRHFAEITSAKAMFVQANITPSFDQVAFALELAKTCPGLKHVIVVAG